MAFFTELSMAKSLCILLKKPAISSVKLFSTKFKYIITEKVGEKRNVCLIKLNKPKIFNVMCEQMALELAKSVAVNEADNSIRAIVLTGSEDVFTVGGDIKEMFNNTYSANLKTGVLNGVYCLNECKKPIIAAVNGLISGIGCELAMCCDIIYAGEDATFGLYEIKVATLPGCGASQRLIRTCGKSFAMETFLTGNKFTAQEALSRGIVSKVFSAKELVSEAIKLAEQISKYPPLNVALCKESVNYSFESNLRQGLQFEKNLFYNTLATYKKNYQK